MISKRQIVLNWIKGEKNLFKSTCYFETPDEIASINLLLRALDDPQKEEHCPECEALRRIAFGYTTQTGWFATHCVKHGFALRRKNEQRYNHTGAVEVTT